jgi:hypothetical protein
MSAIEISCIFDEKKNNSESARVAKKTSTTTLSVDIFGKADNRVLILFAKRNYAQQAVKLNKRLLVVNEEDTRNKRAQ